MIYVPGTVFRMGSDRFKNERPVRRVALSAFWIDKYPVTNAEFAQFVEDGGYQNPRYWTEAGWQFLQQKAIEAPLYWWDEKWNAPDMPVTGVCWWEAYAYARYVGKTLPSEAQWEYAAGLGERTYPWGEAAPTGRHAHYAEGCEPEELNRGGTAVDAYPDGVSGVGCWDMAGNLGEWCLDNMSRNYAWDFAQINPLYALDESRDHMVRGGSGLHSDDFLRCASRDFYPPQMRDNIVGIRCVQPALGESR